MPFQCSICDEPSTRICVRCTKDACDNHICEKCLKCSDCCECEVSLNATPRVASTVPIPSALESEFEAEAEGEPAADAEESEAVSAPLPEPLLSEAPLAGPASADTAPAHDEIPLPATEGE